MVATVGSIFNPGQILPPYLLANSYILHFFTYLRSKSYPFFFACGLDRTVKFQEEGLAPQSRQLITTGEDTSLAFAVYSSLIQAGSGSTESRQGLSLAHS